jgi:hypothetical protein
MWLIAAVPGHFEGKSYAIAADKIIMIESPKRIGKRWQHFFDKWP